MNSARIQLLALLLTPLAAQAAQPAASVADTFHPDKLAALEATIEEAIRESRIVGAAVWLERSGVAFHRAFGRRSLQPAPEPMTEDTIFDVASITKVAATATAAMMCVERGLLALDDPVSRHIPTFTGAGRERITIRHLLLHTSGLRTNLDIRDRPLTNPADALALACRETPLFEPGTAFSYSSIGSMLAAFAVERVTGRAFDEFCASEIYRPLRMDDTLFRPRGELLRRVSPSSAPERGQVDDIVARAMGGVSGHASLFTTAPDLARFARMMLHRGELDGARVLRPDTVKLMTSVQSPPGLTSPAAGNLPVRRGLGWDIDTPYRTPPHDDSLQRGAGFPIGSYGHAGWTGQSLWIDPFSGTFVVFLCNRYRDGAPGSPQAVYRLHHRIATLAAEAIRGFDFHRVPGALPRAGRRQEGGAERGKN